MPIQDHLGNGKVEGLIRTINGRLRTNKRIVLDEAYSGLSELIYNSVRITPGKDNKLPAELQNNRKFTSIKDIITTSLLSSIHSVILLRERAGGTKLDRLYKRKKGKVINETEHTKTLSNKKKTPTVFSKKDVAKTTKKSEKDTNMLPSTSKATNQQNAQYHWFTPEPTETAKPKEGAKTKKMKKNERKKRAAKMKASVIWEKETKQEPEASQENRKKRATDYFVKPMKPERQERKGSVTGLNHKQKTLENKVYKLYNVPPTSSFICGMNNNLSVTLSLVVHMTITKVSHRIS